MSYADTEALSVCLLFSYYFQYFVQNLYSSHYRSCYARTLDIKHPSIEL